MQRSYHSVLGVVHDHNMVVTLGQVVPRDIAKVFGKFRRRLHFLLWFDQALTEFEILKDYFENDYEIRHEVREEDGEQECPCKHNEDF